MAYRLQFDGDGRPFIETKNVHAIVGAIVDNDTWQLDLTLGGGLVNIEVEGRINWAPNEWGVGAVTVWIDRRAPEDFDYSGFYVGKLQAYDEVAKAIRGLRVHRKRIEKAMEVLDAGT